jgi:hypothetical protein
MRQGQTWLPKECAESAELSAQMAKAHQRHDDHFRSHRRRNLPDPKITHV